MLENESLAKYTSWRIGGPARFLANVASPDELRSTLAWAEARELPVWLLGGGTNTLVRDAGFDGLVVRYREQAVRVEDADDAVLVRIGAGAPMAGTVRRLARQGLAGLEWAEGLPGTIGGAVFGNAGCYGGDVASMLTRAWLLVNGAVEEWPVARLGYGYRTSALKNAEGGTLNAEQAASEMSAHNIGVIGAQDQTFGVQRTRLRRESLRLAAFSVPVVLAAEFRVTRGDAQELAERMERTAASRKRKTPWGSSCGSVFKNPAGDSAGRLIEAAGLKGTRVGQAEIAEKHANYIVNLGGASSDDVERLMERAQNEVWRQFGVELRPEVQIIGTGRYDGAPSL